MIEQEFSEWWSQYPRKVGKLAALKAFKIVRRNGATLEDLVSGITRYIEHKPAYVDFCHPQTFLRQGRWLDEYEPLPQTHPPTGEPWWEECKRLHDSRCNGQGGHHVQMRLDALKVDA